MNRVKLNRILEEHKLWWAGKGGKRANLRGANLRGANLRGANLRLANMEDADLRFANMEDANMEGVDLRFANLRLANLRGANLRNAKLRSAGLEGADLPHFQICPEEGSFSAWKKLDDDHIALVEIPAEAKRTSSLIGRKCRAEYVKTVKIWDCENNKVNGWVSGKYRVQTQYKPGHITKPDRYNDDIRVECTNGIHFFMTRREAEEW